MSEPSLEYNAGRSRQAHWTDTEWTHLKRLTEQNHWTNTANRHSTQTEKMDRSSEWTQLTGTADRNSEINSERTQSIDSFCTDSLSRLIEQTQRIGMVNGQT